MTSPAESKVQEATVQVLIESIGIPPASIRLDWAWQLRLLAQQAGPELSDQSHETVGECCDWSQLTLDASGQLHWAPCVTANTNERAALCTSWLKQLYRWSESPEAASASTRSTATLEQRTLDWAQTQDATQRAGIPTPSPASCAPSVTQADRSRGRAPRPAKRSQTATKSRPAKTSRTVRNNLRRIALAVGLGGMLWASVIIGRAGIYRVGLVGTPLSGLQSSDKNLSPSARKPLAAIPPNDSSTNLGRALPNRTLMLSTDAINEASSTNAAGSTALHNFPLSPAPAQNALGATPGVVEPTSGSNQPAMAATDFTSGSASELVSPRDLAQPDPNAPRNVLSELAELSKSAEAKVSEQLLPSATSEPAPALPAPVTLETFPMVQVQKLDRSLRPRQPLWQLRLAVSEGLAVMPATAQALSEDQLLSWTIRAMEPEKSAKRQFPDRQFSDRSAGPKPGTSLVLVQVQLSGKRDPSLRWRIVAASEKYSQIALPLDRTWLDQFQDFLSDTASGLQQQAQRLKELSRTAGIPSQTRSALSAQSRDMETQRELATELLEVVADANQLVGWMDGQIEVHGELLDTAASPTTALLQFGNLNGNPKR